VGVTLFFLISGFLLYRPYAVSMFGGPLALSVGVYARRRALRILPAYWLALTLLAVWPGLPGMFEWDNWALYGLLQSYSLAWLFEGISPAWSLSVEAGFYVMLPFFGLGLTRAGSRLNPRGRLRLQLAVLAVCGAFGFCYRAFTFQYGSLLLLGTTLPAFLMWFAVGMSVAVASAWLEGRELEWRPTRWLARHPGWCWAIAGGVLIVMALSNAFPRPFSKQPDTMASYMGEHVLYALVALLVMLPAVFGEREGGLPRTLMGSRLLRWLGRISYGVFLWHHPLLRALQLRGGLRLIPGMPFLSLTLVGIPLVLACAWLSWRLVEEPALRLAHRSSRRRVAPAG
jgi:peptidoglycan/LPS O-acetylase OafA/YrhL